MLDPHHPTPAGRPVLASMLEARSVAVVGASSRPGSFGQRMMTELVDGGFTGSIWPVNPRYQEVAGIDCLSSIAELPEPADLVLLGVPNAVIEDQLTAAADQGCRSAVVFASGMSEEARDPPLHERLRAIASHAGMPMCGCNCMGFLNLEKRLRACGYYEPPDLPSGHIAAFCHSGSVFSALLHNRRDLRFNLVVSVGTELVTGIPDYIDYALDQASTRVIALFIETIRDPARFEAALGKACEQDVPIVALKVGSTGRSRAMVAAHTGALAGNDGAIEAVFDAYGVTRVWSLDEMADTLELFARTALPGPGGLASIHDSGGERAMLVDVAESRGVPLAHICDESKVRLAAVLEPGLEPDNPLDAWGTGNASDDIFSAAMKILLEDEATSVLAFCADLTAEDDPSMAYTDVVIQIHRHATKPVVVLANLASGIDPTSAARLRAAGVAVLEGTDTGLAALRHHFDRRDWAARTRQPEPAAQVRRLPTLTGTEDQLELFDLLRSYGISCIETHIADDLKGAQSAAERIGYPVMVKSASGVTHKSDVGGVVAVAGPDVLGSAYEDMARRLGPRVAVQRVANPGLELSLGFIVDESFGPITMVAAGGVLIESLGDRRFLKPPVQFERAREVVAELAVVRGARARAMKIDLDAVARSLTSLSRLALDAGPGVAALDLNPVIVTGDGCVAVDALVVGKA